MKPVTLDLVYEKLLDHDKQFELVYEKLLEHDKQFELVYEKLLDHDRRFDLVDKRLSTTTTNSKHFTRGFRMSRTLLRLGLTRFTNDLTW